MVANYKNLFEKSSLKLKNFHLKDESEGSHHLSSLHSLELAPFQIRWLPWFRRASPSATHDELGYEFGHHKIIVRLKL